MMRRTRSRRPGRSATTRRLAAAVAMLWLASAAATLAAESPYGINIHAPSGARRAEILDAVEAAGIGWVRIDFVWAIAEPAPGLFDWSLYDALVTGAEQRGLGVLATIAYTPQWATDGPVLSGVPRDVTDWEDFCFRAAERYRGRIGAWEIWNEPNQPQFWAGSRQQYLDLVLAPGADAIHAADPAARVGGPALAHLVSGGRDWYRWLLAALDQDGDRLDFVTHHVYDSDGARDVTKKLDGSTAFGGTPELWDLVAPSVREVLKKGGWASGPFWLTETGWASDEVGPAAQAAGYQGLLDQWFTGDPDHDWIDRIAFYEIRDDPTPGIPKYGILAADGAAKPAYATYRSFIAAHSAAGPSGPELSLLGGRFRVTARFRTSPSGPSEQATAIPATDESGFFWFFSPGNIELVVKALDGRWANGDYWFFFGALSDVEYWVDVTDTVSGRVRTYHNPSGTYCGRGDTAAFAGLTLGTAEPAASAAAPLSAASAARPAAPTRSATAPATSTCAGDPDLLCLVDARFRVSVTWHDPQSGDRGTGTAIPFTDETGLFWFFTPGNVELAVKLLDGRRTNGHFWVFYGALSDVEYTLRVTDTRTGTERTYRNPPGTLCGRADTAAF